MDGEQVENVIIEEKITKSNGETVVKRYQRGKVLGKGGFAKCYEVTNLETKKAVAAKIIAKNSLTRNRSRQKVNFYDSQKQLISEIKIHKSLHHPGVVQFEHVFEDHDNVYILLEICQNQTLNELIKRRRRLTLLEVQCWINQIIIALKYLHNQRIIHRDLKLGNLFINDKMELKLGDFGLATKLDFDGEKKKTICGTPNYIAPEILEGKTGHSFEVDIWSLGVIIYTLFVGKPPFETQDVKTTYKKIKAVQYSFPDHVPLPENAKNIIQRILVLEPAKRPTLDQILAHPFMTTGTIPKQLHLSTLVGPPTNNWLQQYQTQQPSSSQKRMADTAPQQPLVKMQSQDRVSVLNEAQQQTSNNFMKDSRATSQKLLELRAQSSTKTLPTGILASTMNLPVRFIFTNFQQKNTRVSRADIYVKKWVDYSSKYGLGYLLTNGCAGVFFNDSTKIIQDPTQNYFEYIEKSNATQQYEMNSYSMNDYPKELQKKVNLLEHFRGYLDVETDKDFVDYQDDVKNPQVFVKKWLKTRHAILFRLSNKAVQVDFTDKTVIILNSDSKVVTYINKKAEKQNFPLQTALNSQNQEMTKRLKYTKEILTHMLQGAQMQNINSQITLSTNI
ncbi:Serine/threonine-protein kinase plk1 [Paramecium bursaria]